MRFWAHIFNWAFGRHVSNLHNADYEVCRDPLCWVAYRLELLVWGGQDWYGAP